jgi:hypothetical protein
MNPNLQLSGPQVLALTAAMLTACTRPNPN